MKRFYKYASGLFLTGLLSVLVISSANAQRGSFHGGGISSGSGAHFSGGSSVGSAFRGNSLGSNRMGVRNGTNNSRFSSRGITRYRSGVGYYPGVGYHVGAFYRPGFGFYGYPHLGFYCADLGFGFYPFYWNDALYYYNNGIFYSPYDDGGYQVTAPPIGAGVPNLPDNAQPIKIDGVQYYELDGVYYKQGVNDKGKKVYIVAGKDGVLNTDASTTDPNASIAAPQVGDIVNQLPDGCRKVSLNGKKYYVSPNDIYYEKVTDPDGNVAFRIASLPDNNSDVKGI